MTAVLVRKTIAVGQADALLGTDPKWYEKGLCAQTDPEAFFPDKGESPSDAKRVCRHCEVKRECLAYALKHDEQFGVWGGMSARERRNLKRRTAG